ncbi:MAG: GNAT family N-acetyltransferase, partial [Alicyclobacillus mali]|nr:GNAT family N-acetyltransferase [Alicyclobacillus mali (ex Roth et al. 2021)]
MAARSVRGCRVRHGGPSARPAHRSTDAVVQRLYVREAFRRRGIAHQLMAAVVAIAAREGFLRLVLTAMTSRAGARACYA